MDPHTHGSRARVHNNPYQSKDFSEGSLAGGLHLMVDASRTACRASNGGRDWVRRTVPGLAWSIVLTGREAAVTLISPVRGRPRQSLPM